MKSIVITLFVLTLLISSVAAAIELPTEVVLDADYSKFNDDKQDLLEVSASYALKNTANTNETIAVAVSLTDSTYKEKSSADVLFTKIEEKTGTIVIDIPHKAIPGRTNIGTVTFTQGAVTLGTVPLVQNTKSMLELVEIEIDYTNSEGGSESEDFKGDDDSYSLDENVKPGTKVEIKIELRNLFDNDYDDDYGMLEDVKIELDADDNDIFESSPDEPDKFDIDLDEKEVVTLEFTVDEEVDEGDYTLELTIEVEDGKGIEYTIFKEIDLDINRDKDDVRITKFEISPSKITACDTSFNVNLEMQNYGTSDQDDAAISLYSKDLNVNEHIGDIELDKFSRDDNTWTKSFTLNLDDVKAGTYGIEFKSYIDRTKTEDSESKNVVIQKCSSGSSTTTTDTTNTKTTNDTTKSTDSSNQKVLTSGNKEESTSITKTIENPYGEEDFFVAAFIVAIVLVMILIIVFFVALIKK